MATSQTFLSLVFPSYKEAFFAIFVFCRVSGIFLISPLFSNKVVTTTLRFYFSFFIAIILTLTLYPDYLGPHPHYALTGMSTEFSSSMMILALECLKEIAMGYLFGFILNMIFEGLMWAGEVIDTTMGLSTGQFFDPITRTFQSLSGRLLMLFGVVVLLAVDLHHALIKLLAQSFSIIPLGNFTFSAEAMSRVNSGVSLLFIYALKFSALPVVALLCGTVGIAFILRVMPGLNLLLTGLPLRFLAGLYVLMIAITYLVPTIIHSFLELLNLANNTMEAR